MSTDQNATTFNHFASIYDLVDLDRSAEIAFYRSVVGPGAPEVLELGTGTGTMLMGMATTPEGQPRPGRWVGLDGAQGMLDLARQKAPQMEWLLGDMRCPPLAGQRFDLITCCYNTLQLLLEDQDVAQLLQSARALLKPDGRLVFDLYQPNMAFLQRQQPPAVVRRFTENGQALEVHQQTWFNPQTLVLRTQWQVCTPEGAVAQPERKMLVDMRQYFPADLERLLAQAGLCLLERYGFYDRRPFAADSLKQVMVCGHAAA